MSLASMTPGDTPAQPPAEHLATSERAPCPAHEPREWKQCEQPAGHLGPHSVWYPGFGPCQWPRKEAQPMMPTDRPYTCTEVGALAADRERLLAGIFAIEAGLADGTAPTHWRELLKAARWMAAHDARQLQGDLQAHQEVT